MKHIKVQISGMRCGGCASGVERSLSRLEGIKQATVDVAKKEADVTFEDSSLNEVKIKEAVERLGYKVEGYYEVK
ncbi:MAG TPA: heavy metal-associated domain-containing protein [Bacilli bacterium]|nr:heavy metal-associated domain-containing protein [Bacilli bacterium]